MIRNPVLPGFNPDPSIVRVGPDYYIATSTMLWQPGIRIHHSTDLVHWEVAGHVLHDGVHELRGLDFNAGIWAPSLTYDAADGLFYVAYSVMHSTTAEYFDVDNFVVTSTAITGPWSAPVYLGSVGFDPSIFHDDDGRHWVVTLEWDPRQGYQHPGPIVIEELDISRGRVTGPTTRIYRGGTDRGCLEGPILYKRDGWYYLMCAEGGTGFGHGVTLARSRTLDGWYEAAPNNPFITSNPAPHYGRDDRDYLRPEFYNPRAELQKAGHGSLVETPGGEWYVAHLCARPFQDSHRSMLGRETALQQVEWTDEGWLRLTAGGSLARGTTPAPAESADNAIESSRDVAGERVHDDFDGPTIDHRFSTLRRPRADDWATLGSRPGTLAIRGGDNLTSRFDAHLVATQLLDVTAVATTRVSIAPEHFSQSAGLVVFYDNLNFAYLRVYWSESLGSLAIGVVLVVSGVKRELLLDRVAVAVGDVTLQVRLAEGTLQFRGGEADGELIDIGPPLDATFMSDEATRGFMGTMIGLTCIDSYRKDLFAHFEYFDLQHGTAATVSE